LHDLAEDPEVKHLSDSRGRERFEKLVFVSHWQFTTYNKVLGIPYGESIVLRNAIEPIAAHNKPKDGPIRLIYHTTPHRGLDILLAVYEKLSDKYKDKLHLDVYSSYKIYGNEQRDQQFAQLFDICKSHDHITYHGTVSNQDIHKALQEAHIFAYPSTWQETSCIAAIEAMSAGCAVVCPSLAALPETTGGFALMYPFDENKQQHANMFYNVLDSAIQQFWDDEMQTKLLLQKLTVDTFYDWDLRAAEWNGLLRSMLD
jgi:glycosyltransferase involved in cell wall biosynthesis